MTNLPLSPTAKKILYSNKKSDIAQIIPMPNINVFSLSICRMTMWKELKNWCKEAGIEKSVSFHISRHTFAVLNLTFGADLYTVSKLLGHKDIKTTMRYAHLAPDHVRSAVEKIDPNGHYMDTGGESAEEKEFMY